MSITLDPTKPPNTGESPTLGASRIRNVSAFVLQLLGFAGTSQVTLTVPPIQSVDQTTGIMTLPNRLTLGADGISGKDAVAVDQFSITTAGSGFYSKLPGGLILQWMINIIMTSSPQTVTLPTTFTSSSSFAAVVTPSSAESVAITKPNGSQITLFYSGFAASFDVFAIGS